MIKNFINKIGVIREENYEYNITYQSSRNWQSLWNRNQTVGASGGFKITLLWTTQYMIQLKQVSIMWYLSSVRILKKSLKRLSVIGIASICKFHNVIVDYAFQDINDIPGVLSAGRTKSWGTDQAVLAVKKGKMYLDKAL